jgi:hypothetical protein
MVCLVLILDSADSSTRTSGSANSAGGLMMYVGAIGVSSVMGVSLNLGHLRDQAA